MLVFLLFKFLSKDLIIAALTVYFIRGIAAHSFSRLHQVMGCGFNPGFFFCVWCAAKKHCLANNVSGVSSHIQGVEMLYMGSFKTGAILLAGLLMRDIFLVMFTSVMVRVAKSFYAPVKLLFPMVSSAEAAWPSSMLTTGDTGIHGIFVALAMGIAVPRGSTNRFFNCVFLRYAVGLTVIIIIMNWFQATQGEPALLYIADGVIGFFAAHCLWKEVKQLMGKVWYWNDMYGIKLKFDGWGLHTISEDGDRGDDTTALPEESRDGLEDGYSGMDDIAVPLEDPDGKDNHGAASEDSYHVLSYPQRVVQVLAIRANFPIIAINGYDGQQGLCIYAQRKGEVQEKGMVDLELIGPSDVLMAYSPFILKVFYYTTTEGEGDEDSIVEGWDVDENDKPKEYTETICPGPGRELEITFLVIPYAIEAIVEVRLKLKDFPSLSRAVYGKIKASTTSYGNRNVHLFSCKRARSQFFPCGSTSILPLSPSVIALPYCLQPELHIEVDLTIITTSLSQGSQEEDKNLKFTLKFTREIRSQERELDDDQIEVNIIWDFK